MSQEYLLIFYSLGQVLSIEYFETIDLCMQQASFYMEWRTASGVGEYSCRSSEYFWKVRG